MEDTDSISQKISELKRNITLLEWDMPNIKNDELKIRKEAALRRYNEELKRLSSLEAR